MAIKRYFATADSTITNAYKPDLATRAYDANMGLADSLEVLQFTVKSPQPPEKRKGLSLSFLPTPSKKTSTQANFPIQQSFIFDYSM